MNARRVVYLMDAPFSKWDSDRLGVETMKESGLAVEVWGFSPFLFPAAYAHIKSPPDLDPETYKVFMTQPEALAALAALDPGSVVINYLDLRWRAFPIYKALAARGLRTVVVHPNVQPPPGPSPHPTRDRLRRLGRLRPGQLVERAALRVINRHPSARANWLFVGGGAASAEDFAGEIGAGTEILWAHSFDYDQWLRKREALSVERQPFTVFVDQFLPFHPDFRIYWGVDPPITADAYFPRLRTLFDTWEQRTGHRVVIAAHPRADYDDRPGLFGDREIVKGRTLELVAAASEVMVHFSTSVNQAVILRKPIVFITFPELAGQQAGRMIAGFAAALGATPIDAAREDAGREAGITFDEATYQRYMERYIKRAGSPDVLLWRQLAERIAALP